MAEWLRGELTTLALCWRLDRRDGVTIGLTSHDRDLMLDGLPYRAAPGMTPGAVARSEGLEVDTLDVGGALTADAITARDLAAGRWDGARVRLWAVDWSDPDGDPVPLARGEIGDIGMADGGFTAELRGATALLERPVVEQTSPECRATLGDWRCGVDLAPRTRIARVVEAAGDTLRVDVDEPVPDGWAEGRLRWLDGANGGMAALVAASAGATLTLAEPPAHAPRAGERVMLVEGCDRRAETCRARFRNIANFRGEPHLPGTDLLTRYPGA